MPQSAPETATWLVATKLRPPHIRTDTIQRPRLDETLRHSVSTLPLTLLSAPAGYGKTTMLAALPQLLPELPVAWVTLDTEDNDPIRFICLLAAALGRLHPECGRSVWPCLPGGTEASNLKRAVSALINDILACLPDPFILVLDDLHFVTEPGVHVALEYLLDHQPPQLHVAVGTRYDPPLRLARLAARRQLAELRRPDLGFSQDEAHQLLNETLGLSLSTAEVAALQERTEGWPAGLCLLAGPLGRLGTPADRTQFMAAMNYTERYALDFLAEEVLRELPEDLRRFLIQTSVLSEMTPSACRAVTGREDAALMLEQIYRQNLTIAFITPEAGGEPVYRHHALFARLLARQLERELPGEAAELHRRAARAELTPGRAIGHYLSAGSWEEAAQLMERVGMPLLLRGMAETLRSWYSKLPAETCDRHPELMVVMGRCEIHRGDYAAASLLLTRARQVFQAAGDAAGEGNALTSLITLTYQDDDRKTASDLVQRAFQLPLNPLGQVAARLARAWLHLADGNWTAIGQLVSDALSIPGTANSHTADVIGITYMSAPLAAVPGCLEITERYCAQASSRALPDTAWRLGAEELGCWSLLWRGRIHDALACSEAAEALRGRVGGYPFVGIDVAAQLAVLYIARSDLAAAEQVTERLIQRIESAPQGKWAFYLHAASRSMALLGRHADAEALHQRLAARSDRSPLTAYLICHLTGLLTLLRGDLSDAAPALDRASDLEMRLPIAYIAGSARLARAQLLLKQGRPEEALTVTADVLRDWEQAGTPGCALLDGPATLPTLRLACVRGSESAARVVALFPQPAPAPAQTMAIAPALTLAGIPAPLPDPLTQRELDVLRLLVAGLPNRQIGQQLYISDETVKTHVARILRKLDVPSRMQVVIRARELGLLG